MFGDLDERMERSEAAEIEAVVRDAAHRLREGLLELFNIHPILGVIQFLGFSKTPKNLEFQVEFRRIEF